MPVGFRVVSLAVLLILSVEWPSPASARSVDHGESLIGHGSAPVRPLVPKGLPPRWRIDGVELRGGTLGEPRQSLFQPAPATSARGSAIVIGFIGDDEDDPSCFGPKSVWSVGDERTGAVRRWGDDYAITTVAGPPFYSSNVAYVFGRHVSDRTLQRVAQTVRWGDGSAPPTAELPRSFRLRAASQLAPFGAVPLAMLQAAGPDPRSGVLIGQMRDNRAGRYVARFWDAVTGPRGCRDLLQRTEVRGHTIVRLIGRTSARPPVVAEIARDLRRVSRAQFCAIGTTGVPFPDSLCNT
jgi:hypothetical protein